MPRLMSAATLACAALAADFLPEGVFARRAAPRAFSSFWRVWRLLQTVPARPSAVNFAFLLMVAVMAAEVDGSVDR